MASKKPAKVNSSNKKEKEDLPGKAVLYYGTPGKEFECTTCKRTLIKGIIYEHGTGSYCSRVCIPKVEKVEA